MLDWILLENMINKTDFFEVEFRLNGLTSLEAIFTLA